MSAPHKNSICSRRHKLRVGLQEEEPETAGSIRKDEDCIFPWGVCVSRGIVNYGYSNHSNAIRNSCNTRA